MAIYNLYKVESEEEEQDLISKVFDRVVYGFMVDFEDGWGVKKPHKGIIVYEKEPFGTLKFYKMDKDGKLFGKGFGWVELMEYADTYEEAVIEYNKLVNEEIDRLKHKIEKTKSKLIKFK